MYYKNDLNKFLNNIKHGLSAKDVCTQRTIYCLTWYSKKACRYKFFFYLLSITNITLPLISSLLVTLPEMAFTTSILSAVTSLCASLLALFNIHNKWITYRSAAEYIKTQYTLYLAQVTPYNSTQSDIIYLKNIEAYMSAENLQWYETQAKISQNTP